MAKMWFKFEDKRLFHVLHLSVAFMLIFTAFQTEGNMQQIVIDSIKKIDEDFNGSGYISLAVIYATFATCNWLAPSVLSFIGPKLTMIFGGVTYVLFIGCFLWPQTWLLYLTSVIVGVGAACIWTGQGNYLTLMSDKETIARNSGIFWAMLQSSFLFGNLFVFFEFQGQEFIDKPTQTTVFTILTIVGAVGVFVMFFLPNPGSTAGAGREDNVGSPSEELRKSFALFRTTEMILLSFTFFYTGIELSFFSGVYSACVGFTKRFDDPKKLVGLSGIFIGCGEILGGAVFGIFGKRTIKFGRDPIIILGYVVHMICFFLIFMNLPTNSPFEDTYDPSYFKYGVPNEVVAMLCSFLLGFGDACYNTQIYSILGSVYADKSGPAFALFKFTQSLAAAACFFYASVLQLNWHLLILIITGTIGTWTFCKVEWKEYAKTNRSKPETVAFD
ncbi:UNC93-like protein MFSD11 [Armadillidium nasatum]|uniref:UNC93-like protein MFSD11 n=1 Tax=Armadillidium nasatum TaxID=96803 RepID=A0A5N5TA06_9CRUS|nr:UNC93-like protein MFSD11 [Armadillidium nasatum]